MTIKCLALGTTLDKLYLVQDTDEARTVLCYVSYPYGRKARSLLYRNCHHLTGHFYINGLTFRRVKDYRRCDQLKGIEVVKVF